MDPITGHFQPIPKGEKPPKMKEMEAKLGMDFIEDYNETYLNGDHGQKRFAQRWEVSKNLIFANNMRGGRRSWYQMLDLPKKGKEAKSTTIEVPHKGCEICGALIPLDRAHWVESTNGGSNQTYNILNLCPNCHRLLDRGDKDIAERGRRVLILRETQRILSGKITEETPDRLIKICSNIINHRN